MSVCLLFVIEYPKLITIIQHWINCKVNANETNRLTIARVHFFETEFSYPALFQIIEPPYSVPSHIFILHYFQMDLTDGPVKYIYIYIYIYIYFEVWQLT